MTGMERLRFLLLRGMGSVIGMCGFPGARILGSTLGWLIWKFYRQKKRKKR